MNTNTDNIFDKDDIKSSAYLAVKELCEIAGLHRGDILVIGCSTSEICGGVIGHASSPETAEAVFTGVSAAAAEYGVYIAAQCCEHLNRAIVIEREAVLPILQIGDREIYEVNAVPQPKAGGSFASCAYHSFKTPAVLSEIRADAGIDIGGTLIGMHLKRVAVPLRLSVKQIGNAPLTSARTRIPYIGGSRAVYAAEK